MSETEMSQGALRQRAEAQMGQIPEDPTMLPPERMRQLFYELRVHQIELQMQNDELRRTQIELEASRVRYFNLYDLAPVGYITLNEGGIILEANLTVADMLGVARKELLKRPLTHFILPADQDTYYHYRRSFLAGSLLTACELQLIRANSTTVWVQLDGRLGHADEGTVVYRITISDISQRKESENRFRALIENAPDGINLINPMGQLIYASPAVWRILGYTAEDTLQLNMAELTHPEDVTAMTTLLMSLMQQPGQVATAQYRFRHKDGSWHWLESTISNLLHEPGVEAILFNFRDITQHRQQSEYLRLLYDASQHLNRTLDLDEVYQTIYNFLSAMLPCNSLLVSTFAADTQLITCRAHWNEMGKRMDVTDYPPIPLEPAGKGTQSQVIRTGQALVFNDYQAQLRHTNTRYYINNETNEIVTEVPPDEFVTRSALAVPLKVEEQVIGVVQVMSYQPNAYSETHLKLLEALALHINSAQTNALLYAQVQNELKERKQAETAVRESHHRLEVALDELRLTQAQLVQQERLAAVGQLAAGIAHDFNNILAIITLYVDLSLQSPHLPPDLFNRLETIGQQTERAAHLVQQILDFGRRAVLQTHILPLALFLQEQVELWRRTIPESIKILFHDEAASDCVVRADPTRLQQMFTNLVLNARDAMPAGGELHLHLAQFRLTDCTDTPLPDMPPGDWVRITIGDTGTGISPTVLPRIFEPFFTTKEPGRGSGLGLAQVYGIIKQHQGYIRVQTAVGQGTTFMIYLPIPTLDVPRQRVSTQSGLLQGNGETILIVEDNLALREVLAQALTSLNYRILTAVDGREALTILERTTGESASSATPAQGVGSEIALILSDLVMPEMGGGNLFHTLKQRGLTVPMVILTGHPMETELQAMQSQGLAGWLIKPPRTRDLSILLARILHKKSR